MVLTTIIVLVLWVLAEAFGLGLQALAIQAGNLVESGPVRSLVRIVTYLALVGGIAGLVYLASGRAYVS